MTGVYRKEGELRNETQQTTGLRGDKGAVGVDE